MKNPYLVLEQLQKELGSKSGELERKTAKDNAHDYELKNQLELIHRIDKKIIDILSSPTDQRDIQCENFWQYIHLPLHERMQPKLDDTLSKFLVSFLRALAGVLIRAAEKKTGKQANQFLSPEEIERLQHELEMTKIAYKHALVLPDLMHFPERNKFLTNELKFLHLQLIETRKKIKELKSVAEANDDLLKIKEQELKLKGENLKKTESLLAYNRKSYNVIESQHQSIVDAQEVASLEGKQRKDTVTRHVKGKSMIVVDEARVSSKCSQLLKSKKILEGRIAENTQMHLLAKREYYKAQVELAALKEKNSLIRRELNNARVERNKIKDSIIEMEDFQKKNLEIPERIKKNLVLRVSNLKPNHGCYHYLMFPEGYVCVNFQNIGDVSKTEAEVIQVKIILLYSGPMNGNINAQVASQPDGTRNAAADIQPKLVRPFILNFRKNSSHLTKFCWDIVSSMMQEKRLVLSEMQGSYGKEIAENREVLKEYQLSFGQYSSVKTFMHSLRERLGNEFYLRLIFVLYWTSRQEHSVKFFRKVLNVSDYVTEEYFRKAFCSSQLFMGLDYKLYKKYIIALSHQFRIKENGVMLPPAAHSQSAPVICSRDAPEKTGGINSQTKTALPVAAKKP